MKYRASRIALIFALSLLSAGSLLSASGDESITLRSARATVPTHEVSAATLDVVRIDDRARAPASASPAMHPQVIDARTRAVRGVYLSAPALALRSAEGTARFLKRAGMNAAAIDFKDSEGRVTATPEGSEPTEKRPVTAALLKQLDELGIYTIARIVCFSDPVLPRAHAERAVLDGRPNKAGQLWADWGKRNTWLDPYHPANQQMVIDLALHAQALGFREVQLDYIRFPVDSAVSFAVYPSKTAQSRVDLLTDLMRRVDEALEIPLGVDVFGTTAFRFEPQDELGQNPERWAKHVQVFSPMLYMNKMSGYMAPGPQRAERLVRLAIARMRAQIGPGPVIRPFLQAFERGADYYTPEFITEQVRGAKSGGADGYLFWDPGSSYSIVYEANQLSPMAPIPRRKPVRDAARAEL